MPPCILSPFSFFLKRNATPASCILSLFLPPASRVPLQLTRSQQLTRSYFFAAAVAGWLLGGTIPFMRRYVTTLP